VENVLRADDYSKEDAATFSFSHETALLDAADSTSPFANETIWKRSTIKILLPCERHKFSSEDEAPKLRIRNVRHRSLVEVMRTAAKDESAKLWHNTPFKMFWKPTPESLPQRIISELYNADAFLEEHDKISKLPAHLPSDPPTPKPVENAVFAIMIWSDSTHLTNFGDASMWPIYLYPGNQSKYPRGRPTQHSAHHVAYIPSVPDDFSDTYMRKFGKPPSKAVETHVKRELMQKVWLLMLDDEFVNAYRNGIVTECADSLFRRYFPRFFIYSADYPEKILISTIRFLGIMPAPRALVPKKFIPALGTKVDEQRRKHVRLDNDARRGLVEASRKLIFQHGVGITGVAVEERLQPQSLTPTRNAFSEKLSQFDFNFFSMLVSDLLHEIELGNWKAVFVHLMRILQLIKNAIPTLNKRLV
ncbi:hypothetical protein CPB84DRAFT_1630471, partial [Gymnopilus junonius]